MKFAVNASIMFIFQKEAGKRRKRNKPIISITHLFAVVSLLGSQAPPCLVYFAEMGARRKSRHHGRKGNREK